PRRHGRNVLKNSGQWLVASENEKPRSPECSGCGAFTFHRAVLLHKLKNLSRGIRIKIPVAPVIRFNRVCAGGKVRELQTCLAAAQVSGTERGATRLKSDLSRRHRGKLQGCFDGCGKRDRLSAA